MGGTQRTTSGQTQTRARDWRVEDRLNGDVGIAVTNMMRAGLAGERSD